MESHSNNIRKAFWETTSFEKPRYSEIGKHWLLLGGGEGKHDKQWEYGILGEATPSKKDLQDLWKVLF